MGIVFVWVVSFSSTKLNVSVLKSFGNISLVTVSVSVSGLDGAKQAGVQFWL